ncbi:MAG TPA: hypothetical protein VFV67_15460 [Actinophytocola sp.]|uniref:hypothetical protein n=1 Tax=Actinophytocola sp. TaxID=1872138 RepID=UPI002DBDD46E|nr:hypothetical protein [Actinophytocola sp.]HEU5472049.1 hypothetical protein [Actinophytocola sp.]
MTTQGTEGIEGLQEVLAPPPVEPPAEPGVEPMTEPPFDPSFFCVPVPRHCVSSGGFSVPVHAPCLPFGRPSFLSGGGLSALLAACLDLNLKLRPHLTLGGCRSWSPC